MITHALQTDVLEFIHRMGLGGWKLRWKDEARVLETGV